MLRRNRGRGRVLADPLHKVAIRTYGDVLPTFLVDVLVAGASQVPLRGRAALTHRPLEALTSAARAEVEPEGERPLAWLRPDSERRELRCAAE